MTWMSRPKGVIRDPNTCPFSALDHKGVAAMKFNSKISGAAVVVAPGAVGTAFASGDASENAIGGGFRWDVVAAGEAIILAGPSLRNDGTIGSWRVDGQNNSDSYRQLVPYVTCMKA